MTREELLQRIENELNPGGSGIHTEDIWDFCYLLLKDVKTNIIEWAERHYWDSLERDRNLIIEHIAKNIDSIVYLENTTAETNQITTIKDDPDLSSPLVDAINRLVKAIENMNSQSVMRDLSRFSAEIISPHSGETNP